MSYRVHQKIGNHIYVYLVTEATQITLRWKFQGVKNRMDKGIVTKCNQNCI